MYLRFRGCYVHRLVAQAFLPCPENKCEVNHENGIKHDNEAINLKWCTSSENKQHAWDTELVDRQKHSESLMGKKHSVESKQLMSKSQLGRKCSEETKQKLSKSLQGKKQAKLRKLTDTQESKVKLLFSEGSSRAQLAIQFNVSYSLIKRILKGLSK